VHPPAHTLPFSTRFLPLRPVFRSNFLSLSLCLPFSPYLSFFLSSLSLSLCLSWVAAWSTAICVICKNICTHTHIHVNTNIPTYGRVHSVIYMQILQGQRKEAEVCFQQAISITAKIANHLHRTLLNQGNTERERERERETLSLSHKHTRTHTHTHTRTRTHIHTHTQMCSPLKLPIKTSVCPALCTKVGLLFQGTCQSGRWLSSS